MNDRHRLKQLRVLLDRLERMPASPNRDRMLNEVRARAVDVETGVRPAPIRPLGPDEAPVQADARERKAPKRRDTTPRRTAPSRPRVDPAPPFEVVLEARVAAPGRAPVSEDRLDLLEQGGELCLGDSPTEAPEDGGRVASPPWARGLRG
jgi:hypothetical protein